MLKRTFLKWGIATTVVMAMPAPAIAQPAGAKEHTVKIKALPKTIAEFVALRDQLATEPLGAAAVFVVAGILYSRDEALGLQALTVAIDMKWLVQDPNGYKGYAPSKPEQQRFKDRWSKGRSLDYVPRSYVHGTSPANEYKLPSSGLEIKLREQTNSKESDSRWKLFVHSTGADSPRPIQLVKNDKGIWKAFEWSSLTSGVRAPAKAVSDDL